MTSWSVSGSYWLFQLVSTKTNQPDRQPVAVSFAWTKALRPLLSATDRALPAARIRLLTASDRSALRRYCRKLGTAKSMISESTAMTTTSSISVKPRRRRALTGSSPAPVDPGPGAAAAPLRVDRHQRDVGVGKA